jgi:hypothetical protein
VGVFVGFTPTTHTGNLGGRPAAHQICHNAFSGSHLCHAAEYLQADSAVTVPAAGAWVDPSSDGSGTVTGGSLSFGRYVNFACSNWTTAGTGFSAYSITASGGVGNTGDCNVSRALACCSTPTKTRFAGFTVGTTNGNMGGRPAMHAMCAAEYPGSHFCHAAEYLRAASPTTVPATGAWVDPSTVEGGSTVVGGVPRAGRYVNFACSNWTTAGTGFSAYSITAAGGVGNTGDCNVVRPLACCGGS